MVDFLLNVIRAIVTNGNCLDSNKSPARSRVVVPVTVISYLDQFFIEPFELFGGFF